jgi:hypothetical protein
MTDETQHHPTGTCPCCRRTVPLNFDGGLREHGYGVYPHRRIRECFCTGYQPLEVSSDGLRDWIQRLELRLAQLPEIIARLKDATRGKPGGDQGRVFDVWTSNLSQLHELNNELMRLPYQIGNLKEELQTWTPKQGCR